MLGQENGIRDGSLELWSDNYGRVAQELMIVARKWGYAEFPLVKPPGPGVPRCRG